MSKGRTTNNDLEQQQQQQQQATTTLEIEADHEDIFDYSKRSQWLRAAVLGANDGLVSTASIMMGVGAVKHDIKAMILSGFAVTTLQVHLFIKLACKL